MKSFRSDCLKVNLIVWNPSIRKFHDIPPLPEIENLSGHFYVEIGLGYDPLVKDYKHVKFIFVGLDVLHSVAVYTLGVGTWKMIPFHGKGCFDWHWRLSCPVIEAVYLRGSLYFTAFDANRDVLQLASFDLSNEKFRTICLPTCLSSKTARSLTLVRNGCSSLAVFDIEYGSSMWVLETESMCWTQPYPFNLSVSDFAYGFLYLKKNRDMLMWWWSKQTSFSFATGNRLEQVCELVSSYNLATGEEKIMLLQKEGDFEFFGVFGYIESLLLRK